MCHCPALNADGAGEVEHIANPAIGQVIPSGRRRIRELQAERSETVFRRLHNVKLNETGKKSNDQHVLCHKAALLS